MAANFPGNQKLWKGGGTGKVEKTRSSREEAAALAAAGIGPAPQQW